MIIKQRNHRYSLFLAAVFILSLSAIGCSLSSLLPSAIDGGASKADVIAEFGQPDQVRNFILPDEPFFGPQESLVNLVPAGTLIEEWVYEDEDNFFYVWFAGGDGVAPENWRVLTIASYPRDAVY